MVVALTASIGMRAAIPEVAEALGHGREFYDAGDIFEQLGMAVEYIDERLAAAAASVPLPEPPQLRGDVVTTRIAYVAGLINDILLIGVVLLAAWRGPRRLARDFGLDRSPLEGISRPVIAAAIAYVGLAGYALAVDALGIEVLKPGDAAPRTLLRDDLALALFAVTSVVGAPLSEEVFFRGFVFRGFLHAGFVPAALLSAGVFAAWHFDVAALLPFAAMGFVMAWLYWQTATLWQPMIFHGIVNLVTFVQFAGER